jgi:predicted aconitase with swiveling domain
VTLNGHPQRGQPIADRIVVLPQLIGSGSSSAIILELIYKGRAPRALILGMRDAILPIGVLVADEMGWPTIPVLVLMDPPLQSGQTISIRRGGLITPI